MGSEGPWEVDAAGRTADAEAKAGELCAEVTHLDLVHKEDLAAQVARQRFPCTKGGQQEQVVGACHYGEHLDDLSCGTCQHRHAGLPARRGARQRLDIVGRHALEKIHAIGVRKCQHAAARPALQRGT